MKKLIISILLYTGISCALISSPENYYVSKGTEIIKSENKSLDDWDARQISYYLYRESIKHKIDFHFALGIMRTESRFNPKAKSYCGAIGLMQLMPKTAQYIAKIYNIKYEDLYDIKTNIQIGTAYLFHLKKSLNDYSYVAAGYNGGKGTAYKYIAYTKGDLNANSIPKETRNYVPKVMNYYYKYKLN